MADEPSYLHEIEGGSGIAVLGLGGIRVDGEFSEWRLHATKGLGPVYTQ